MTAAGRLLLIATAAWSAVCAAAVAQTTTYEVVDGIQYQVTKRPVQVAVPQVATQQQTVLRQQMTTQTLQHQQQYTVPVTQYQLVSRLHGRWNPFVTPYWTHEYQPVTVWQQQTATVQIPVNSVAWVPETRTVQAPTTTYRTVEQIVRTPIGAAPTGGGSQQMLAGSAGAATTTSGPTATLAARPSTGGTAAPISTARQPAPPISSAPPAPTYGGRALTNDPPAEASGWTTPSPDARYRY